MSGKIGLVNEPMMVEWSDMVDREDSIPPDEDTPIAMVRAVTMRGIDEGNTTATDEEIEAHDSDDDSDPGDENDFMVDRLKRIAMRAGHIRPGKVRK